jgi:hypothetical protein
MAAKIVLSQRKLKLEKMLLSGEPLPKIGQKLGVSISTLHRYLRARRSRMPANFHGKQAIVFDTLLRKSIEDHEKLGQLIDQEEKFSLVVTDAYGKRLQIRRDLARFMGIDHEVKVQNIQNNLHLQDNRSIQPGPVQIIVEANGEFDPEYGNVRITRPSDARDRIGQP